MQNEEIPTSSFYIFNLKKTMFFLYLNIKRKQAENKEPLKRELTQNVTALRILSKY